MSECKAKVVVEICAETAVDAVSKRVAGGMKVLTACKEVAEEFNKENDAVVTWKALRTSYYRAQKCNTDTLSKKVKKLNVPIVTPKMQDDIDKLKGTCVRLRTTNSELQERLILAEAQVKSLQALLLEYDKTPIVKSEQEQRDEFINTARKAKEDKAIAERKYFGVGEDGTPV